LSAGSPGNLGSFPKQNLDEKGVRSIIGESWESEDLSALIAIQDWSETEFASNIKKLTYPRTPDSGNAVMVFRQRAAIFGYNAPDYDLLQASFSIKSNPPPASKTLIEEKIALHGEAASTLGGATDVAAGGGPDTTPAAFPPPPRWEDHTIEDDNSPAPGPNQRYIFLDTTYPGIVRDSLIALIDPASAQPLILQVADNQTVGHINFTISGKVSRLTVILPSGRTDLTAFKMRTTSVLAVSEPLTLADLPIDDPVPSKDPSTNDDTIVLDGVYLGLKKGRNIILTGQRADLAGVSASEVRALKDVRVIGGFTVISLDQPLAHSYVRKTMVINANIAAATHGESVQETLGAGDASQQWQRFTLRQPPLTYVSAPTPSGGQTTLEVRVDDVLWHEAPNFYGHDSDERVYVTRMDDNGNTTVIFGGGARLSTGQENIKAKYRKGVGLSGLVRANQLTQLMSRPLGLKGVTNPLAPSGAADPEKLQDARGNAPLTVLTLDRVVSLQDYEDFARAFSGIDKALATSTQLNGKTGVYLTVAGTNGAAVDESSKLYSNLVNAISVAGDLSVPFSVKSYNLRLFTLSAAVELDSNLLPEKVRREITAQLRDSFSFEARSFGQPVHLSEVIDVIQNVTGVIGVEVRTLYLSDQPSILNTDLTAQVPKPGADIKPAELLALDPRPVVLEVIQ
jgi:predicted phage baseplate assembly protein